jgi:hypothetical protein
VAIGWGVLCPGVTTRKEGLGFLNFRFMRSTQFLGVLCVTVRQMAKQYHQLSAYISCLASANPGTTYHLLIDEDLGGVLDYLTRTTRTTVIVWIIK